MNEKKISHHWLEAYDRTGGLELLFIGFNNALKFYRNRMDEESWYDIGFYWEDPAPLDMPKGLQRLVLICNQHFLAKDL